MTKAAILALATGLAMPAGVSPAAAFWQRSQVSVCADATSEAELMRHRCWELNAYADPGWPAFGARFGGAYGRSWQDLPGGRSRKGAPVTRRLG
jgi:hypothetical protein